MNKNPNPDVPQDADDPYYIQFQVFSLASTFFEAAADLTSDCVQDGKPLDAQQVIASLSELAMEDDQEIVELWATLKATWLLLQKHPAVRRAVAESARREAMTATRQVVLRPVFRNN